MLAAKVAETISEPLKDEPESREKVVGEQREVEERLARDKSGRAVFFVNFPLTPMFISPKAVQFNIESKLYELKPNYEHAIPKDLIPDVKLKDAKQLSTVLGRVLSLWKLEQNPVIIFYVEDRKNVDPTQFVAFKAHHPKFTLIKIKKDEYALFKEKKVSEATYAYCDKNGAPIRQCIFATQIINPKLPSDWQILEGRDAKETINHLNELLKRHNQEPIPLETKTNDERMCASIRALHDSSSSIFVAPQQPAANEATANSLPTAESCRSSHHAPSK